MFDLDKWQEIWATLSRNKLRTSLTALGVVWGVFMMMSTIGFARGFRDGMSKQMAGAATNAVWMWGQRTSMPYKGMQPGRYVQLDNEDMAAIRRLPGIEHLAPRLQMGGWRDANNISRGRKTGSFQLFGDQPDVRLIQNFQMLKGRFLDPLDVAERRKVAVIGPHVHEVLFSPGEDPIGQYIQARGVYFQVIGMFKPSGKGDEQERQSNTVMVPFSTFQNAFNSQDKVDFFAMTVDRQLEAATVEKQVKRLLAERHTVHPDDPEGVGSFNLAKEFKKAQMVFTAIEAFAWIASILTLLAGVLGVSNILLIAVKERTKEIGVRKALGATPGVVVRMIVQESIVLTAVAGYVGLVAGVLVLEAASALLPADGAMARPQVDFGTAILSVVILVVSGGLAGIIPARHAARIPPVEALRAE